MKMESEYRKEASGDGTMATKQEINEIVDHITKSLWVFATLAVTWFAFDSLANITNVGVVATFAGLLFVSTLVAMIIVVGLAGYLLVK